MRRFLPANYAEFEWTTTDVNQDVRIPLNGSSNPTLRVEWGDGSSGSMVDGDIPSQTHIYSSAGVYNCRVYGDVRDFRFNLVTQAIADRLTAVRGLFPNLLLADTFRNCRFLVENSAIFGNTHQRTLMEFTFRDCLLLDSLDMSYFNTSNVTSLRQMVQNCTAITSLDISGLDLRSLTSCGQFASGANALATIVVGDAFDDTPCTAFINAFDGCALNQSSVDAILISINNAGTINGTLGISGGTNATPSVTGQAATDALRVRGWTVTLNGY